MKKVIVPLTEWMTVMTLPKFRVRMWWNSSKVTYEEALKKSEVDPQLTRMQKSGHVATALSRSSRFKALAAFEVVDRSGNGTVVYPEWP